MEDWESGSQQPLMIQGPGLAPLSAGGILPVRGNEIDVNYDASSSASRVHLNLVETKIRKRGSAAPFPILLASSKRNRKGSEDNSHIETRKRVHNYNTHTHKTRRRHNRGCRGTESCSGSWQPAVEVVLVDAACLG